MTFNHALQRTRRERRGCNRCVPCAGSLSLGLGITSSHMIARQTILWWALMPLAFIVQVNGQSNWTDKSPHKTELEDEAELTGVVSVVPPR